MKKYAIPVIILFIFLFTICLTDCGPDGKRIPSQDGNIVEDSNGYVDSIGASAHLIELQVNTADINDLASKKTWKFKGQGPNEPDSLFTTEVGPGDRVIWVGVSSSSIDDKVEITKIKHMYGAELITKNTLTGKNGVVVGDIVKDAESETWAKYKLWFRVEIEEDGVLATDSIPIDPKLRIHGVKD
jgi:hypothetical protein